MAKTPMKGNVKSSRGTIPAGAGVGPKGPTTSGKAGAGLKKEKPYADKNYSGGKKGKTSY